MTEININESYIDLSIPTGDEFSGDRIRLYRSKWDPKKLNLTIHRGGLEVSSSLTMTKARELAQGLTEVSLAHFVEKVVEEKIVERVVEVPAAEVSAAE